MKKLIYIILILSQSTLGLASDSSPFDKVDDMFRNLNGTCNYPILKEYKSNPKFMCKINALKERCNKIDDCYVYCYSNDIGLEIGGGCTHLCNYSLKKEWAPPKSSKECDKLK